MTTQYYRIEDRKPRAYDMIHNGTILAIDGNKEWILSEKWCGGDVTGYCYRPTVAGIRKPWPKAADKAIDKTQEFEKLMEESDGLISWADDLSAKQIRDALGL